MNVRKNGHAKYKEGGWGWIVLIACAFCFGVNISLINIYPLINNELVILYNSTENKAEYSAWIGTTSNGVEFFFCIISSMLINFIDARKVGIIGGLLSTISLIASGFVNDIKLYFLTYGFGLGIGQSLVLASLLSILPHYFYKRIGLINGFMNLGGTFIRIAVTLLTTECLKKIKLSNTFFVLSGLVFLTAIFAITFQEQLVKNNQKDKKLVVRIQKSMALELFKKRKFIVWLIGSFMGFYGYIIPTVTITHHSSLMFPNDDPAVLTAILCASSGLCGVIFGQISDLVPKAVSPVHFHILSFLLGGIVQMTIIFAKSFLQLCIIIAFFGAVDGLFLSFIVPISCSVADSHISSSQASGFLIGILAIPVIVAPTVSRIIFEQQGSYEIAYYIGGSFCLVAGMFLLIAYRGTILWKLIYKVMGKSKSLTITSKESER